MACFLNVLWYIIAIIFLAVYIEGVGVHIASIQVIPWLALVFYIASILFHLYVFVVGLSLYNQLKSEYFVEQIA